MKVREMIEWLKTVEDQDADGLIVSHTSGTGYYDQGGNAMEAEFDPVLHTEYVDMRGNPHVPMGLRMKTSGRCFLVQLTHNEQDKPHAAVRVN